MLSNNVVIKVSLVLVISATLLIGMYAMRQRQTAVPKAQVATGDTCAMPADPQGQCPAGYKAVLVIPSDEFRQQSTPTSQPGLLNSNDQSNVEPKAGSEIVTPTSAQTPVLCCVPDNSEVQPSDILPPPELTATPIPTDITIPTEIPTVTPIDTPTTIPTTTEVPSEAPTPTSIPTPIACYMPQPRLEFICPSGCITPDIKNTGIPQ